MTKSISDLFLQYFCLILLPFYARGDYERTCRRGEERPRTGVCGRELSNTLDIICDGNFNTYGKRNSGQGIARIPQHVKDDLKSDFKDKILSKQGALNFLLKRSGIEYQGLTCECCQNQCSMPELMSYCADPDDFWFFNKKKRAMERALKDKTRSTLKLDTHNLPINTLGSSEHNNYLGRSDQ
ncbi:MPI3-like protein [Mya arenaria]|uniref:MPI3-like protein n=2 Tax=Mya arenaria TaxID=6604 RepID=A0ABY7EBH3_MYAAR|nr:MPI3-like protein [Mya arenaria]